MENVQDAATPQVMPLCTFFLMLAVQKHTTMLYFSLFVHERISAL